MLNLLAYFTLVILLIVLFFQDLKNREISLWLVILLFVVCLSNQFLQGQTTNEIIKYCLLNSSIIAIQFLGIFLFYSIKNRQMVAIFKDKIGIGDLLFLFAITPLFRLDKFMFFITLSLFAILIFYLFSLKISNSNKSTIPLAGALSVCLLVYLLVEKFLPTWALDKWINLN